MSRATLIALLLACAGACAADGEPDPGEASVELGTGEGAFEPIADEQVLPLIAGPQGGHHFIVHARARGLDPGDPARAGVPENPSTRFVAFAEDGRRLDLDYPPYRLGYLEAGEPGVYALPAGRILQLVEAEVPALDGARVRLQVTVRDAAGREVSDERWVVAAVQTLGE